MATNRRNPLSSSLIFVFLATTSLFIVAKANNNYCKNDDFGDDNHHPIIKSVVDRISSNPTPAVEAVINFAIYKTKDALETTEEELKQNGKTEICEEMYKDAISDLNQSMEDLKKGNFRGLKANLCSAMTYYTGCDDAYEKSGEVSPFTPMNEVIERLINKCLPLLSKWT